MLGDLIPEWAVVAAVVSMAVVVAALVIGELISSRNKKQRDDSES